MRDLISNRFRHRRNAALRDLIVRCRRRGKTLTILDVGGRLSYWRRVGFDFLQAHDVRITLANISEREFEPLDGAPPIFDNLTANGCDLPFDDLAFDLCHSNSVIEHVGGWRDFTAFARETRRVAASYFVQTPSFWFPVDPHFWALPFYHWLPGPVRAGLLRLLPLASSGRATDFGHAYAMVDSSRLLTRGQMAVLFPDATLRAERVVGLAKSYTAERIAVGTEGAS